MKSFTIPVTKGQINAYQLIKGKRPTISSKENMKKVAQNFGALGLPKWQALSLAFNYFRNVNSVSTQEKIQVLKNGILEHTESNKALIEEQDKAFKPFWKIDTKRGFAKVIVEPSDLVGLLTKLGFYKFKYAKSGYVKLEGNIITEIDLDDMQESVKEYLYKIPSKKLKKIKSHSEVWDFIINRKYLFRQTTTSYLPFLNEEFHRDKKDEINLYLENGFLKITHDNFLFKPYCDLQGIVWKNSIVKAPFTKLDYSLSNYEQFILNTQNGDLERMKNVMKILGYLVHRYNFHDKMKIICLTDEIISSEANGGTGKNLTLELLKFIRPTVTINGKRLNSRSQFVFQMVEDYHDVILLNDVRRNFNVEDLYSDISEGIEIEKKGINAKTKERDNTGKFVFTTNYRKLISSGSTRRRIVNVFYSNYYNSEFTVADEFRKMFFVDFDEKDWNQTFTFAIKCCQLYLKEGLPKSKSFIDETLELNTSKEFVLYMDEKLKKETRISRSKLRIDFQKEIEMNISAKEFCKWTEEYFRAKNIITKGFVNSNGKTYASKQSYYYYEIVPNN